MAKNKKILESLEDINSSISTASSALDDLNKKALGGGLGFDSLVKSMDSSIAAASRLTSGLGNLGSAMGLDLGTGILSKGMGLLSDTFGTVMGGAIKLAALLDGVGGAIDSVTGFSRNLNASLYESVSKFNGSFASAKQFSEYIISSAQDFAKAEAGFISPADRISAVKGLEQAGIPLEHMSDIISSAAGKMDLLNTAFLHSKSLGLEVAKYTELIGQAMLKQGLTSQQAAEQMAMFGDISNSTGLRVDKVAGSLQTLAGNFSKLGLTADFGQPILEGFADSLKGMGLGFENAIELSESLSGALVKLTSNYAAAYVTFQRGGLDMGGGGGALGAGIGLRASLLESNKEGGDQGKIAMEMANALKDTLASFTGGQIVTVQEAAADPALQATFYTQTKLLEDLYGIQDPGAQDRTLELLQELGNATKSGNIDLAESLGKDLQEITAGRSETLGYQEKTAKYTEATFAEINLMNRNLIEGFRISGDSLSGVVTQFQDEAVKSISSSLKDVNAQSPQELAIDFQKGFSSAGGSITDTFKSIESKIDSLDNSSAIISALKGITMQVSNKGADTATGNLKRSIDALVSVMESYISKRDGKAI